MTCCLIKFIHFLRYNAIACLDYSTVCMLSSFSHVQLFESLWTSPPGSSVHGNSLGKNTGVGSHFLLPGIFPTQVSYISFIGRQILYQYSVNIAFICTGKQKKKKLCDLLYGSTHFIQWPATQFTISPTSAYKQQWCWWGTSGASVRGVRGSRSVKGAVCWHLNGAWHLNGVFYGTTGGWVLKPEQTNSIGEAERKPAWLEQMRETGTNRSLQGLQPHRPWEKAWVLV